MTGWCVITVGELGTIAPVTISRDMHTFRDERSAKELVRRAVSDNKFVEAHSTDEPNRKISRDNVDAWLAAD
jgi:hypothetical protein